MSKKLKLGFWGNANNYPFMLARAFKRLDYEVLFIVDDKERLRRPENRYEDISLPYPDWIKDFSPFPLWLVSNIIDENKKTEIIKLLRTCDLVLLNGYPIRFAEEIKKPHLAVLTGSDLDSLANYDFAKSLEKIYIGSQYESNIVQKGSSQTSLLENKLLLNLARKLTSLKFFNKYSNKNYFSPKNPFYNLLFVAGYYNWAREEIKKQRDSIKNGFAYMYFSEGLIPAGDNLLQEIGADKKKRLFNLMVDINAIDYCLPPANASIRIFNLARFSWVKNSEQPKDFSTVDYKGNDVMIKGIALYLKKHPTAKLDIRFVKKGQDTEKSIQLCNELNLAQHITWLEELNQKEIQEEYKQADIIFDQLDKSVIAMGGFEAMAVGRPLIGNSRPEIFEKLLGEKTAICQAETLEEVCNWLTKLIEDKKFREDTGIRSREFVKKHFSTEAMIERILEAYNNSAAK